MSMEEIIKFIRAQKATRIALATHQRPDGDALGSTLGLAAVLRNLGYTATVVNALPIPKNLAFLVDDDLIMNDDNPDWHRNFDCLGVLDCGEIDRLGTRNQVAASVLPAFTIDHHISSNGVGESIWIDPQASSTGEMVVRLCAAADWPILPTAALALWVAIVTDTGRFSYENTSPAAMETARLCLLAGANPVVAATHIYQSVSAAQRILEGRMLTRMEMLENSRLAVSWMTLRDFQESGIDADSDLELINLLRDITDVEVAVFLYEVGDINGEEVAVKVSLRTRSPHNAVDVVKKFGGGGHMRAAGCTIDLPLEEAKDKLLQAVREKFFTR